MTTRTTALARLVGAGLALAITAIALATRLLAVDMLGTDFDEDDYLRAGPAVRDRPPAGRPVASSWTRTTGPSTRRSPRSPSGSCSPRSRPRTRSPTDPRRAGPADDLPEPHLTDARTFEAVVGALTAGLLALVSPIGGLWLAIHTWSIKYTSQVMLEAVPAFFALLAVLLSTRAWRPGVTPRRRGAWLVSAAVALGLACAGKYLYGVAGLAIVVDWALRVRASRAGPDASAGRRRPGAGIRAVLGGLVPVAGFLALAFVAFLLADPYLWPDPVGRLASSLGYHVGYAGSEAVQETGWPVWQPLVWLMGSVPRGWQEEGTFVVAAGPPDHRARRHGLRAALAGAARYALWLGLAFLFLLAWPTKWPQYVLVLSTPLCLAAGLGTESLLRPWWVRLRAALGRVAGRTATRRPRPDAAPAPPRPRTAAGPAGACATCARRCPGSCRGSLASRSSRRSPSPTSSCCR